LEEPVEFENQNGCRLRGIVHIPFNGNATVRIGFNLLNPGIKYRVAPNRLNVKIARYLCDMGYFVLRFDPEGVGDSEGELPSNVLVPDIWEDIQKGRFVSDTIKANDVFIEKYNLDRLIVAGNCGGAISALLASIDDYRIDGLCLIDVPVNLRLPDMQFADKVTAKGKLLDFYFYEYLRRALKIRNWYRFLTFQSDLRSILKVISKKLASWLPWQKEEQLLKNIGEICEKNNLNKLFFSGFSQFVVRNKPVLFILAGHDSGTEIFKYYFESGFLENFKKQHSVVHRYVNIHYVEEANHIYTAIASQHELINCISNWMKHRFSIL
jgi:pimeloyl-ACP methyl ester carboxylesterase